MGLQMGKYTCLEDLWHPNMLSLALAFDLIAASRQALVKGLECLGAPGLLTNLRGSRTWGCVPLATLTWGRDSYDPTGAEL